MTAQIVPTKDRLRVLIVEDEESFLQVLKMVLQSTGRFTVLPCQTGEDALKCLEATAFDVVILDLNLPGMSGLNVLQWMNEQKLETPVIMLTGTGSEYIAAESMKLGAYDYVAKTDFDRDHFPVIVSGVVERYLFKKTKLEEEHRGTKKGLGSLELFGNSISSLADVANNALARVTLISEECHHTLQPTLTPEGKEQIENFHGLIKQELDLIVAVTRSILELSQSMLNRYATIQNAEKATSFNPENAGQVQNRESGNDVALEQ
jgi:CheY-like chemotaxis protein